MCRKLFGQLGRVVAPELCTLAGQNPAEERVDITAKDLHERMGRLSVDELRAIVRAPEGEYTAEAITIAQTELDARSAESVDVQEDSTIRPSSPVASSLRAERRGAIGPGDHRMSLDQGKSSDQQAKIEGGRSLVALSIFLSVGASVATIVIYVLSIGVEKLPLQIFRLFLTVVLWVFVYRGYALARAIMLILVGVAIGFLALSLPGAIGTLESTALLGTLLLGGAYAFVFATLLLSGSVKAFLESQKESRSGSVNIWPAN